MSDNTCGYVAAYHVAARKFEQYSEVADSLEAAGDHDLADRIRSYAEGYLTRAGDALLTAAEEIRQERAP